MILILFNWWKVYPLKLADVILIATDMLEGENILETI